MKLDDTIKIDYKFNNFIGHRGLAGLETENTIKSFLEGAKRSYFALECDVHTTIDKKIVVCHDDDLLRVSGNNMVIREHTLKEVQSVPLYDLSNNLPSGEYFVPLFSDYLDICIKYNKIPVVELKGDLMSDDIDSVIEMIKEKGLLEKVIIISFYPGYITDLRRKYKDLKIMFLSEVVDDSILDLCVQFGFGIDANERALNKYYIDKFHKYNLLVNAYTVNDKKRCEELIECGIDYITTNLLESNE